MTGHRVIRIGGYAPRDSAHSRAVERICRAIDGSGLDVSTEVLWNIMDDDRPAADLLDLVESGRSRSLLLLHQLSLPTDTRVGGTRLAVQVRHSRRSTLRPGWRTRTTTNLAYRGRHRLQGVGLLGQRISSSDESAPAGPDSGRLQRPADSIAAQPYTRTNGRVVGRGPGADRPRRGHRHAAAQGKWTPRRTRSRTASPTASLRCIPT